MKTLKTFFILIFWAALLLSQTSCVVHTRADNGRHKGWYRSRGDHQNENKGHDNGHSRKGEKNDH